MENIFFIKKIKKRRERDQRIEKVMQIYEDTLSSLDKVLIGQKKVKNVVASSLLCDTNSRILCTGPTGAGKTILTKYLASSFNSERIQILDGLLPEEIQNQLKNRLDLDFLQIDEFNRASGRVQSTFIEFFEEKQISTNGEKYNFEDFYVFATQNPTETAGIFNVPQAIYDRFDVNISFDDLNREEKRKLLFSGFKPATQSNISKEDIDFVKTIINNFVLDKADENLLLDAFSIIKKLNVDGKLLFAGTNYRADEFAIKLAKITALAHGRLEILSSDIAYFINNLYMHRIDQNVARIYDDNVKEIFHEAEKEILKLKRKKTNLV